MQISISVMLMRDFRRNRSACIRVWQIYIIHHGPSFQQVKNTLYMCTIFKISFLGHVVLQFCELQNAINGLRARIRHRKSVSWMRNWAGISIFACSDWLLKLKISCDTDYSLQKKTQKNKWTCVRVIAFPAESWTHIICVFVPGELFTVFW